MLTFRPIFFLIPPHSAIPPFRIYAMKQRFHSLIHTLFFTPFVVLALSANLLATAHAQMPQAPEVAAKSYLLMDVTSNQILASKDIDSPVEPASLTKLMTGYLVFDALKSKKIDLKQTFPVRRIE